MKTVKLLFAMLIVFISIQSANAQTDKAERISTIKTQTIKVYGECGMCKKRIEKAANSVEGIKAANWNEDSQTLTIKFDVFSNYVVDNVQRKVASVGHDAEKYKADNSTYEGLPDCCHYSRKN